MRILIATKILIVICLTVLLNSCDQSSTKVKEDPSDLVSELTEDNLQSKYGLSIFDTLQNTWLQSVNAKQLIKKQIEQNNQSVMKDEKFVAFLNNYNANITQLNELLLNHEDFETINSLTWKDTLKHEKPAKYFKSIVDQLGFSLSNQEGIIQLDRKISFIDKELKSYLSPTMTSFWKMYQIENKEAFAVDAQIIQPLTSIIDRIIYWERFQIEHPDFPLIDHSKFEKQRYIYFLFAGMDNSPAFDSSNNQKLKEDFLKAYYYALEQYPESNYANLVNEYLDVLEKNDFQYGEYVDKFLVKISE